MRLKRLSNQIYLTIVVILLLVVGIGALAWRTGIERGPVREAFGVAGEFASAALPPAGTPMSEQRDAINRLAQKLDIDMALFDRNRRLIVQSDGAFIRPPRRFTNESGFIMRRRKFAWALQLSDGRLLVSQSRRRRPPPPAIRAVVVLGGVALIIGLCAWPVVRGLTRRLETLQAGVERLGSGDLTARVDVRGRDEIAALATSFNRSAQRIESLVSSHRLLLANASHELRTPLARIRLALEWIREDADSKVRRELEADISELDDMIEEILLLSRLDARAQAGTGSDVVERVDVLALVAEECARYQDCDLTGDIAHMDGDPQLLRRLVRNLLENATRHGEPPIAVKLNLDPQAAEITLDVTDHGPGVAPNDVKRVFEPFHRGSSRGKARGSGIGLALVKEIAAQYGGTATFLMGHGERLNRVRVTLRGNATVA